MKVVKLSDVLRNSQTRKKVIEDMKIGKIFVYPTDTIYGIGCSAEVLDSVEKIEKAKGRESGKKFSVIAPGEEWIWKHADMSKANMLFADSLLPGPYTIVVKARPNAPVAVVSFEDKSMGIRIPKHPIAEIIKEAGIPFISTSVNLSGEKPVSSIDEIPEEIKSITDWAIDAGRISGLPSRVFDLRGNDVKILRY